MRYELTSLVAVFRWQRQPSLASFEQCSSFACDFSRVAHQSGGDSVPLLLKLELVSNVAGTDCGRFGGVCKWQPSADRSPGAKTSWFEMMI